MSNPAFNDKLIGRATAITDTSRMTINGTINKTGILLLIMIAGSVIGWSTHSSIIMIVSFILNLVFSLLIIFKPQRAPYLSQPYAFTEGLLLGTISSTYAVLNPGIVSNALFLTVSCLLVMLGLYRFKIIQVTEKFRSILLAATMAIGITYLINIVMGLFGTGIPMIHQSSTIGIAFSVVVVGIAAFNLLLDFDLIEKSEQRGLGKFMEWYCGFALLVTLVWLYLEILRLLSKLNRK